MKPANSILSAYGTSVFEDMNLVAQRHGALNLSQGAPDTDGPEDVVDYAAEALRTVSNQYPPLLGLLELRRAAAAHDKRFYGLDLDPEREILITAGATQALAACLFALIEPGDEVILIEPMYDSYLPIVKRAGGVPRLVRLVLGDEWTLPEETLAAAFSPRTKLLVLNSPMNPAAKVFSREELALIAELAERHDAYVLCDEVYEHLVFDGRSHLPLMGFPRMRGRTLRVASAGKTLSLTGWKVGYIAAAPDLLAPVVKAHQFMLFTVPPNLQAAVAAGLAKEDAFYGELKAGMEAMRDRLAGGLVGAGFNVFPCHGTYFLNADFRPLASAMGFTGGDTDFCHHMAAQARVSAIPVSAFYDADAGSAPDHIIRFCFARKASTIDEAIARLVCCFGS